VITVFLLRFIKKYQGEKWMFCFVHVCVRMHTHACCVPSCLIQMRNENDVIPCLIFTRLSLDVYRVLIKLQLRCESLTSHRILCSTTNLTWNSV